MSKIPSIFSCLPEPHFIEHLTPKEDIYLGKDYSIPPDSMVALEPETSEGLSFLLKFPRTHIFADEQVEVGPLFARELEFQSFDFEVKTYDEETCAYDDSRKKKTNKYHQVAEQITKRPQHATIIHALTLSPYWIGALSRQDRLLEQKKFSFLNLLILYRLIEVCLLAIAILEESSDKPDPRFQTTLILLMRQRFLYLAQLSVTHDRPDKFDEYLPGYRSRIRAARREYAQVLLEQEDEAAQAFAQVESDDPLWDMDQEALLLLYQVRRQEGVLTFRTDIWDIAQRNMEDSLLTDTLLRKWFLAHDSLNQTAHCVKAIYLNAHVAKKRWRECWHKFIAGRLASIYNLLALGLAFFFIWFFLSLPFFSQFRYIDVLRYVILFASSVIGLVIPLVATISSVVFSKQTFISRQALYPLALRIPAMGLVGTLALAGLADAFVTYALNAFQYPGPASVIAVGSLAGSFLYIYFEVQTRVERKRQAIRRASCLWVKGLVATTWLAILTGWLADPVGLTECKEALNVAGKICDLDPTYGMVIKLHRAVVLFGARLSFDYILMVTVLALLFGVFTQIFWEDKTIAEPL